ncbi:hypothetical protein, partial [Prochlorothrix hollandica]|uniref:hypothetical protein n=1 Tax=Prochlorothrix hollandica TaxID=1223 RepID=UPI003341DB5F
RFLCQNFKLSAFSTKETGDLGCKRLETGGHKTSPSYPPAWWKKSKWSIAYRIPKTTDLGLL